MKRIIYMLLVLTLLVSAVGVMPVSAEIPDQYLDFSYDFSAESQVTDIKKDSSITTSWVNEAGADGANGFMRCTLDFTKTTNPDVTVPAVSGKYFANGDYDYILKVKVRQKNGWNMYLGAESTSSSRFNVQLRLQPVCLYTDSTGATKTKTGTGYFPEKVYDSTNYGWVEITADLGTTWAKNMWDKSFWGLTETDTITGVRFNSATLRLTTKGLSAISNETTGCQTLPENATDRYIDIDDFYLGPKNGPHANTNVDKKYENGTLSLRTWLTEKTVPVVFAEYGAGGELVNAGVTNHTFDDTSRGDYEPVTVPNGFAPAAGNTVKLFVWNNLTGLSPLTEVTTYTVPAAAN